MNLKNTYFSFNVSPWSLLCYKSNKSCGSRVGRGVNLLLETKSLAALAEINKISLKITFKHCCWYRHTLRNNPASFKRLHAIYLQPLICFVMKNKLWCRTDTRTTTSPSLRFSSGNRFV